MSTQRFFNPYNFVRYLPLGKENETPESKLLGHCAPPPHDRYLSLTGKIECELEAVTPIFVSDSEFVDYNERIDHKSYRFFKLKQNGKEDFAIPSTTLRGMIRSVFEAVTNSCFSVFEGALLGKRETPEMYKEERLAGLIIETPKSEEKPGRVKRMKYYKLPHDKFPQYRNKFNLNGKRVLVKIENGEVVSVKDYSKDQEQPEGFIEGYLKTSDKGISGPTKKINEYVFVDDEPSEYFELSYETYINYIIANRNNRQKHTQRPEVGDTIWFIPDNEKKVKEFGYTQIYRKPFKKSIGDLLFPKELFHPCKDYNNLCPACRVFGWVHPGPTKELEKVAYAGRIKISHAKIMTKNKINHFTTTLTILSTPKPTTTFFYLLKNGKPELHIAYETDGAQLRGRKFYRHQEKASKAEYSSAKPTRLNRTIKDALEPGAKFTFVLEFENLAPVELGALLWSLELEDEMHHKLGLAKPLGFGSVKISIKNLKLLNIKNRYQSYSENGWKEIENQKIEELKNEFKKAMKNKYGKSFEELENIKDLKAILSPPHPHLPVHYPRMPSEEGRNFKWFMRNRKEGEPLQIACEDHGLPLYPGKKK